jgi:hypothetical protein
VFCVRYTLRKKKNSSLSIVIMFARCDLLWMKTSGVLYEEERNNRIATID